MENSQILLGNKTGATNRTEGSITMSPKQTIDCSCSKCGRSFTEPVELTVQAEGSHETYYACPHCFSRVSLVNRNVVETESPLDKLKKGEGKAPPSVSRKGVKDEKNKPAGCAHFLGYLKTRPKGSPIPDECLLCAAIIECM